jgi:ribosomal-protein-serine acetyltransferase
MCDSVFFIIKQPCEGLLQDRRCSQGPASPALHAGASVARFFIRGNLLSQEISDGTLLLRPFRLEDAEEMFKAVRESLTDLKPWMSWAYDDYSFNDAREFIRITRARWQEGTLFAFAITEVQSGLVLGGCSLSHIHPVYHLCNLGYWVRSSRRGEGIAGRATRLAARYAFEKVGLVRVEIVIAPGNEASLRVARKVGAHYEGLLRNRMVVGREVSDAAMYSLIPQDFGLSMNIRP